MSRVDFVSRLHKKTGRNYLERVLNYDKAECAMIARQFARDYWDGERQYGYGGYKYDGRWRPIAQDMAEYYRMEAGQKVLDVGCGKAFLLYELSQVVPGLEVAGIDISSYAIDNTKEEVKGFLRVGNARELPYEDNSFDLVYSITTLHNLCVYDLKQAVQEIERVSRKNSYIVVESYRNEREKVNR
ncbi:MAG: class I SAM-dependent methyltransferase, partial [Bacillota bacterium]|nr:class I SAM-dependent methyltransferase [Bacillota bacterium]